MKLYYRESGSGFPLIILHGLLGLSDNWVTFARRISEQYRVIIPDLRNHGQSPGSEIFDFPSLVEDIRELMDDLKIPEAFLLGHSLGGKTAAMLALESSERVLKLVVVDISLRKYTGRHEHLDLLNAMMALDLDSVSSRAELEHKLADRIPSQRIRQFLMKSVYWKDREHLDWRLRLEPIRDNLPKIFESITPGITFNGPVLFVKGENSDYILDEDLPEIINHFPEATVETITGASHWVHADAPEEFFNVVSAFLAD